MNSPTAAVLAPLSDLITKIAADNLAAHSARQPLIGESLALYHGVTGIDSLIVCVDATQITVRLLNEHDKPSVYIVGNPIEACRALQGRASDASITGDINPWANYFNALNIDWISLLQPLLGESAAVLVGGWLNNAADTRAKAALELDRLVQNFKQYEAGHYSPMPTVAAAHRMLKDAATKLIQR